MGFFRPFRTLLACSAILALCARPGGVEAASIPPLVQHLAAWYDASYSGSITTTANPNVTTWTDKSGNTETLAQATSGNQPTYSTNCVNGLGCLTFNGTSSYLLSNDTSFSSKYLLPQSTVFIVQNSSNDTQTSTGFASVQASTQKYFVSLPTSSSLHFGDGDASTSPGNMLSVPTSSYTSTGTHLWTLQGKQGTGATQLFNRDGTTMISQTPPNTTTSFSCPISVGASFTSSCTTTVHDYFSGSIEEIVVYSSALSQTNYQHIEGYLACKWGLQGNLPAGHPYKSTCPSDNPSTAGISGLAAWYDASDTSTITFASNPSVSGWSDRSGNSNTLSQATSANQPTYTTSCVNGLACMTLNGSSAYLLSNNTSFSSQYLLPASSVFVVGNSNNDTQTAATIWSGPTANTSPRYLLHIPWSGSVYFDLGNSTSNRVSATTSTTGTHLWAAVGSESTGTQTLNKDGTTIASGSGATVQTGFSCPLEVGAWSSCGTSSFGDYFSGSIEEIIIYNAPLSQAEYQYTEGYLACKWGIQSNLPTGHPYKSTCPSGTASFSLSTAVSPTGAQVPGTNLAYTTTYTNNGGLLNYNPVVTAPVPANTDFKVGTATSNQQTTGLSVAITYSNNSGSTYVYTPTSAGGGAASGYDRSVTNIKWTFTGPLGCGSPNNTGTVGFTAAIR